MYGDCEICGKEANLDCAYNPMTGEELYVCLECEPDDGYFGG